MATPYLATVFGKAPEAHILTTRGIGGITINDPLLKALNDCLLRGQDMTWPQFWQQIEAALGKNPRFVDYVPPHRNAGAAFLAAYRTLMRARPSFPVGAANGARHAPDDRQSGG